MGLSWQQGPLAPGAVGRFLVPGPLPDRMLFAEPTMTSASATVTASARPSSRSPSPGSPATGSACASASLNCLP